MASSCSICFIVCGLVHMAGVADPGYRCAREVAEGAFQHAPGTKRFRCVGKDFGAALPANSDYLDHCLVVRARSLLYSVKFRHTLRRHEFLELRRLGHEFHEFTRIADTDFTNLPQCSDD